MKLTGQDQPLATPIVEEPSSGEDEEADATDEDVESFEEVDGDAEQGDEDEEQDDQNDELDEDEDQEIIEFSPCSHHVSPFRHNPLILPTAGGLDGPGSSNQLVFPRPLLKKPSTDESSSDVRSSRGSKRVSFAEDRGDVPTLLRYNPDVSCMDILRPLEEQFTSKNKRSSILRRSVRRSQEKVEEMQHDQTQF